MTAVMTGMCQLCGEREVELCASDYLPEEFEGIGCRLCCEYYADEATREERRQIEKEEMALLFEKYPHG